jgi:hypothetical protein
MNGKLLASTLAVLALAACASPSTRDENWAYTGPDAALRLPPAPVGLGDAAAAAWQLEAQEKLEAWRRRNVAAADAAKDACALETRSTGARGPWSGYDAAFLACMKTKGWQRVGNPA